MTQVDEDLGRTAYEAYLTATGGVSLVSGESLPSWDNNADQFKTAWVTVGQAVRAYTLATLES